MTLTAAAVVIAGIVVLTSYGSVESRFDRREPLTSCGSVTLGQLEEVPAEAWACLDAGRATGAELVVTTPTTEGDPMRAYYRVGPGVDGLEIYRDTTADTYGSGGWSFTRCPGTVRVVEPTSCRTV